MNPNDWLPEIEFDEPMVTHPILRNAEYGGDPTLLCPKCGQDCSHIRRVFTRFGSDQSEARVYEGTQVLEASRGERRSALVIQIDGECGHSWNLVIQQHKGINYVTTEPIPALEPRDVEY